MTATGAVAAVLIVQHYFGGKVKNVTNSLEEIQRIITEFQVTIEERFAQITSTIVDVDASISGLQDVAASTQAAVYDNRELDGGNEFPSENEIDKKRKVYEIWEQIRGVIEKIASSDEIDGRTRAKYARKDRRSYYTLLESLSADGRISDYVSQFNRSAEIWYSCRRSSDIRDEMILEIEGLRDRLFAAFPDKV